MEIGHCGTSEIPLLEVIDWIRNSQNMDFLRLSEERYKNLVVVYRVFNISFYSTFYFTNRKKHLSISRTVTKPY